MSNYPKLKKFCRTDAETIKTVFPVTSVTSYGNGVFRVNRESKLQGNYNDINGRKDRQIMELSKKSLQLLTATIQATEVKLKTMITLTYPRVYPKNGKQVKKMLNATLGNLRSKGNFEYLWFLEFQRRGAPHIHLLTSHSGITPAMRINLAHWWVGKMKDADWFVDESILQSIDCDTCHYQVMADNIRKAFSVAVHKDTWQMIRKPDGAKRYVTAYATKPHQKEVPEAYNDVGRFWGCSKAVMLADGKEIKTDEDPFMQWLKKQDHPAGNGEVLPKYIYGVKGT